MYVNLKKSKTIYTVSSVVFQSSPSDLVIQVALISESVRLQQMLSTYGILTQTPHQVEPIQIWPPCELAKAYEQLGVNHKLGLSGRPPRPVGGLGTAKVCGSCGSCSVVGFVYVVCRGRNKPKLPLVRRISDMLKTTCPLTCPLVQVLVHFVGPK